MSKSVIILCRRPRRLLLYLIAGLLLLLAPPAHAQQPDFQAADSLTQTLARQYPWAELDTVGRALGAGPAAHDAGYAARSADLTVYLRQHHGERDLAGLADALRGTR